MTAKNKINKKLIDILKLSSSQITREKKNKHELVHAMEHDITKNR